MQINLGVLNDVCSVHININLSLRGYLLLIFLSIKQIKRLLLVIKIKTARRFANLYVSPTFCHSVSQASASGTGHTLPQVDRCLGRHSVTQASASGTFWSLSRLTIFVRRHSVTQASASGTPMVVPPPRTLPVPPFSNTGISEWHLRQTKKALAVMNPPFSNTGISEWHKKQASASCNRQNRHSVTQASASGTGNNHEHTKTPIPPPFSNTGISEWHGNPYAPWGFNSCRHSVTQASASGTAKVHAGVQADEIRHSVTQASASGTALLSE